jgi:hypothetical protein|eukprot:COSAG06_NODE_2194_length_7378_cov_25.108119_6_plen_78_part_00
MQMQMHALVLQRIEEKSCLRLRIVCVESTGSPVDPKRKRQPIHIAFTYRTVDYFTDRCLTVCTDLISINSAHFTSGR